MLVDHPHPRRQRRARIAGGQGLTEDLYPPFIGDIVTEKDVHQRRLASAVFAKQSNDFPAPQGQRHAVVGRKRAEAFGYAVEAEDNLRLCRPAHDDFGSPSSMVTVKLPSLIAASFAATMATTSAGTLPSKVPSGAREQPPAFMKE